MRSFTDGLSFIKNKPIHLDDEWATQDIDLYLQQFKIGKPISYIFGVCYFLDYPFVVNQHVLIPRFETEILVEQAQKFIQKNVQVKKVADIGCGPGTIGLSLLQLIQRPLELHALDISESALNVFEINRSRFSDQFHPQSRVATILADRLTGVQERYDLILSNPPYIKQLGDATFVHKNVAMYEPAVALYLPDEIYLKWFMEFFQQVDSCLVPGGQFIMEGHEHHLEELANYLPSNGRIEFYRDLSQRLRGLIWHKNGELSHG